MRASRTSGVGTDSAGERAVALQIFLNYRREDASGHAGHLFEELASLGKYDVFMDIEKIGAGIPFREAIDGALTSCDVFLALIGRHWLDSTDKRGRPRLDNPNDLVRLEIEGALSRKGVRVVPLLLQEAEMPAPEALPEPLRPLTERNALELSDTHWDYYVEQLVAALDTIAAEKAELESARRHEEELGQLEAAEREARAEREAQQQKDALRQEERAERKGSEGGLSRRAKRLLAGLAAAAVVALGAGAVLIFGGDDPSPPPEDPPTTIAGEPPPTPTERENPSAEALSSVDDPFPLEAASGLSRSLPIELTFEEDDRAPGTVPLEAGFTGLMTNGTAPVSDLFDPAKVVIEDGALRVDAARGDPAGEQDRQRNAFQFGIDPPDGPFTAHVRLPKPFEGLNGLEKYQSLGLFLGTGDQDNYVKLVVGYLGAQLLREVEGSWSSQREPSFEPLGLEAVDLYLTVDPEAGTVAASVTADGGESSGPIRFEEEDIPRSWLDNLAVGIISTTGRDGRPFRAEWELIEVRPDAAAR